MSYRPCGGRRQTDISLRTARAAHSAAVQEASLEGQPSDKAAFKCAPQYLLPLNQYTTACPTLWGLEIHPPQAEIIGGLRILRISIKILDLIISTKFLILISLKESSW